MFLTDLGEYVSVTKQLIVVLCNVNLQTNETKMLKFCSESHGLWTPLHTVTEQGYSTVTELLIEENSNLDVLTEDGFTPLNTICMVINRLNHHFTPSTL